MFESNVHLPARRVFEIPELIGLICTYMEPSDLVKLLTVSRCLYNCVVPLIWSVGPGISELVNLLPSDSSKQLRLEPYDEAQLARFDAYTPFIQKFQLSVSINVYWLNWVILLANVPTRPLLPNLRVLDIVAQDCREDGHRAERCVSALLCPTLSDISIIAHKRWLDPVLVVVLLSGMAQTCSNLSKLCMPLNHSQSPSNLNPSNSLGICLKDALLASISQFHNLRVLRSSPAVLDPGILQSLGDLPHLESLIARSQPILDVNDEQFSVADFTLSMHSFPALRHLRIGPISSTMVSRLWRTAPFGRNLVSVAIKFRDGSIEHLNSLICDICRGSPLIMELELDLDEIEDFQLSNAAVDHFQQLPLKLVDISYGHTDFHNLVPAFRNVEYLVMEESLVDFEDLVMISKDMPKLQYLSASLFLWGWLSISDLTHHSPSPRTCHIDSYFNFENEFDLHDSEFNNYVDLVAQTLHSLWPKGVRCGFCRLAKAYQEESDIDIGILERINTITRELSGTSALHIPSVEESRSLWMY